MQALLGSAKAPANQPVLIGSNIVTSVEQPNIFKGDINFGNEDGANRLLVIVYGTEGVFTAIHTSPKYDGVAGVLVSSNNSVGSLITPRAATISVSYWVEAALPSSDGNKEFQMSLAATGAALPNGHHARAFLFKNVNQTTPAGSAQTQSTVDGTPTFQMSITAASLKDKAVVLGIQTSLVGGTYITGDHKDNGSNMNDIVEQQARPNADTFGGGAFASAHDIVPDSSEAYVWDVKYGASASIEATLAILVPINPL